MARTKVTHTEGEIMSLFRACMVLSVPLMPTLLLGRLAFGEEVSGDGFIQTILRTMSTELRPFCIVGFVLLAILTALVGFAIIRSEIRIQKS